MKTSVKFLSIILFIQFSFTELACAATKIDTVPLKDWKIGISTGLFKNNRIENSYQLGVVTEYITLSPLAIELDISGEFKQVNLESFGRGRKKEFNIDASINAKYYLGNNEKWYGKLGYYLNRHLFNISEEYYSSQNENNINSGIQLGFGRNWSLRKGRLIRVEPLFRYNVNPEYKLDDFSDEQMHGGIKLGLTF